MGGKVELSVDEITNAYKDRNLDGAAEMLGVSVPTLRKRMKAHGMASHSRSWRPGLGIDKDVLVEMYKTKSVPEIADVLRLNRKTVYARMREHGIKLRTTGPRKAFDPSDDELKDMYMKRGMSVTEIADHFGVGSLIVVRRMDELGLSDEQIELERERRKQIEAKEKVSFSAKLWRRAVLQRDDYKCVKCGLKSGVCDHCGQHVFLHTHHIKQVKTHPELRYTLSNGITLCRTCHSKEHKQRIG